MPAPARAMDTRARSVTHELSRVRRFPHNGLPNHAGNRNGASPTITCLSGSSTSHPAVPNEPQFRPDNPRVCCWRRHAPKTGFSGNCCFPQWTSLRPAFVGVPSATIPGAVIPERGRASAIRTSRPSSAGPAVGARRSARYEGPGAGYSRPSARDCATFADARCRPDDRTRAVGGFRRQRAAEALTLEDPYAAIEAECGDHRALLTGKHRRRPHASPAPSIGPPAGSKSEPHRDADAATGKSCATSPGTTSGSGPCDGTGRDSSAAKVPRPPIGYYE